MMEKNNKMRVEKNVCYLIDQLKSPDIKDDSLSMVACLFQLKTIMAKSMSAQLMFRCFELDIVPVLMEILNKDFNPRDEKNEVAMYSLAMETLWLLTRIKQQAVDPPLSLTSLCTTLSQFLDVSGRFYQFGADFQERLSSICCEVSFPQQRVTAVLMTEKIWNDVLFYKPSMKLLECARPSHLHQCHLTCPNECARPSHLHQCHLTCPNEKTTQHGEIKTYFINQELAWTLPQLKLTTTAALFENIGLLTHPPRDRTLLMSQGDDNDDKIASSECDDVYISEFIGGHYFWARLGSKTSTTMKDITEVLSEASASLKTYHPCVGDVAVVLWSENGTEKQTFIRGRVVKVLQDEVTVFAMDHGSVRRVEVGRVFRWPESAQHLSTVEAQAKICCLAGVQAPPASMSAVELALATLTNLTNHYRDAGEALVTSEVLDCLCVLLHCGPSTIRLQATRLLVNLCSTWRVSASVDWSQFIRPLLEVVIELSGILIHDKELDNKSRNMAVSTLYALTNVMFRRPANRELFLSLNGHIIVLNLLRVGRSYQTIKQAAVSMLKAVYPGLNHVPVEQIANSIKTQAETKVETEKTPEVQGAAEKKVKNREVDKHQDMMQGLMPEEGDSSGGEVHMNSSKLERTSSSPAVDSNAPTVKDGDSEAGNSSTPVDGVFRNADQFYVYATCVPYRDDQTHDLLQVTNVNSDSFYAMLQTVCAMVNSEGGTIFAGLSKQGRVQGLRLSREDRDCVRLSMDRMASKIKPPMGFNQLQVNFVQIMRKNCDGELEPDGNNTIIEIHVKASQELQFHAKDEKCFQRKGSVNTILTEQDARKQVVKQEEKKYLFMLKLLQQQHRQLCLEAQERDFL